MCVSGQRSEEEETEEEKEALAGWSRKEGKEEETAPPPTANNVERTAADGGGEGGAELNPSKLSGRTNRTESSRAKREDAGTGAMCAAAARSGPLLLSQAGCAMIGVSMEMRSMF
ncbi:hypothetical protein Q5P01_024439 [Channa striata]|uniref:Uncharacterized protein n=1 Tax=Channa striata TaxID=64152 RepID=A0AA88LQC0_CHASR|nr:hypothetical protein Q5P01_024439 [Channa striata]